MAQSLGCHNRMSMIMLQSARCYGCCLKGYVKAMNAWWQQQGV
jgi:hypothetical protein